MKPTCCKNNLHERHGQLGFPFSNTFSKHAKELQSFVSGGTKAQFFGDKKNIVSAPHLTAFRFFARNLSHILKLYGIVLPALETSSNIIGDRPLMYLWLSMTTLWTCSNKL